MGSPSDIGQKMDKLHRPKIDWKLMSMFLFMSAAGLFLFQFLFNDGNTFSVLKQVYSVAGSVILVCGLLFSIIGNFSDGAGFSLRSDVSFLFSSNFPMYG